MWQKVYLRHKIKENSLELLMKIHVKMSQQTAT